VDNPQDFIGLPFDWLTILIIVLGALGIYGFGSAAFKITKRTAMFLLPAIAYLFVRDAIPNQALQEVMALGVVLFYGAIVIWFFFFRKK
jgi:hypothetical protein